MKNLFAMIAAIVVCGYVFADGEGNYAWKDVGGWYAEWWPKSNTNTNIEVKNECLHLRSAGILLLSVSGTGRLTFMARGSYDGFFYNCDGKSGIGSFIRNSGEFEAYTLDIADDRLHTVAWATYAPGYIVKSAWGEVKDVRWNGMIIPIEDLWNHVKKGGEVSIGGGTASTTAVPTATAGAITIPVMSEGCPVTSIGDFAFCNCSNITSVTIPTSIKTIRRH